jgi:hypothetical protein
LFLKFRNQLGDVVGAAFTVSAAGFPRFLLVS